MDNRSTNLPTAGLEPAITFLQRVWDGMPYHLATSAQKLSHEQRITLFIALCDAISGPRHPIFRLSGRK